MKVFLVRHATAVLDKERWQTPKSHLGELGQKQARLLAASPHLKAVDLVLTSEWPRARETAEIITLELKKPLRVNSSIHEREQHPKIYGAKYSSKIGAKYYQEAINNYNNLNWRFESVEESFRDVANRALKFRKELVDNYLKKGVVVVSHDVFIRCFIAVCILGKEYQDDAFIKIFMSLRLANAGISLLEYDTRRKLWKIVYLNDYFHL